MILKKGQTNLIHKTSHKIRENGVNSRHTMQFKMFYLSQEISPSRPPHNLNPEFDLYFIWQLFGRRKKRIVADMSVNGGTLLSLGGRELSELFAKNSFFY